MKINSIGGINFLDRPEKDESLIYDNKLTVTVLINF